MYSLYVPANAWYAAVLTKIQTKMAWLILDSIMSLAPRSNLGASNSAHAQNWNDDRLPPTSWVVPHFNLFWLAEWEILPGIGNPGGVYIRWNGMVEWRSGMDYWNGGMLHRTYIYLIIQHVLYSEQWALRCVLCMHCWDTFPQVWLFSSYLSTPSS